MGEFCIAGIQAIWFEILMRKTMSKLVKTKSAHEVFKTTVISLYMTDKTNH